MSYDMTQYEYPKVRGDNGFPAIVDTDNIVHPIVKLLKDGERIESVEVVNDWTDDHEICCDVAVVIDDKKYGFSALWLSRAGYKMLIRAEMGDANSINELIEYICSKVEEAGLSS